MGTAVGCLHGCGSVCDGCPRPMGAYKTNASGGDFETRDDLSDCNDSDLRSSFLVVLLLAGFLPLLHAASRSFLLNDRKPRSLRNLVRRLTGGDVCNQLGDLPAGVVARHRRVVLATFHGSSSQTADLRRLTQ